MIRVGDTAVVCGIRGETLNERDTNAPHVLGTLPGDRKDAEVISELGLLVPNIELATGCNPRYLPGNPPSTEAQSLTQRVLTLLRITDLIKLEDLQIWDEGGGAGSESGSGSSDSEGGNDDEDMEEAEGGTGDDIRGKPQVKAYWTLYIDILVISLDGSVFDAAWGAVLAALGDLQLPRAWWDMDRDGVLCDPRTEQAKVFEPRGCPIPLSFAIFSPPEGVGSKKLKDEVYILTDPDDFEEGCCAQTATVVVDDGGKKVLRIEMGGGVLLSVADISSLVEQASSRWENWKNALGASKSR